MAVFPISHRFPRRATQASQKLGLNCKVPSVANLPFLLTAASDDVPAGTDRDLYVGPMSAVRSRRWGGKTEGPLVLRDGRVSLGRRARLLPASDEVEFAAEAIAEWINPSATAVSHTAPKQLSPRELTLQQESRNRHRAALYEGFKNRSVAPAVEKGFCSDRSMLSAAHGNCCFSSSALMQLSSGSLTHENAAGRRAGSLNAENGGRMGHSATFGVRRCLFLMSLFKSAGIKSVRRTKAATVAVAMILVAGSVFAAETPPLPERPTGGPPSDRPPVIDEEKAETFWENLIESEEDNEQLAADASVPP